MKTRMTKRERIITWAKSRRERPISHAMKDLNSPSEKAFRNTLNRLQRQGIVSFTIEGRVIKGLHLTQQAYYNRGYIA